MTMKLKSDTPLRTDDQSYTWAELQAMSVVELGQILSELNVQHERIAAQLRDARAGYAAEGISSPYEWYRRADASKRISNEWIKRVAQLRKTKASEAHEAQERPFVRAASRMLAPEVYASIWAAVKADLGNPA